MSVAFLRRIRAWLPVLGLLTLLSATLACGLDDRGTRQRFGLLAQAFVGIVGLLMAVRAFRRRSRLPRDGARFGRYKGRGDRPPRETHSDGDPR